MTLKQPSAARWLLMLMLLVSLVSANNESLRFRLSDGQLHAHAPVLFDDESLRPTIIPIPSDIGFNTSRSGPHDDRLVARVSAPSVHSRVTHHYYVRAMVGSLYEARVCWPASVPAQFSIALRDNHDGSAILSVTYLPDYVSQVPSLMLHSPLEGAYEVIVNFVVLEMLPLDIAWILVTIPAGAIIAYFLSSKAISFIL
ncbi:uncharacterized protein SAPINGB_P005712 [Magnusiomyces paraingens]|uniref:Protein PBN1 n=1 Tax=Magnusiomyces paraingens TaxID=2606893 RepID=A0A5E8C669_9ASCO|nr:uncharacterized protein SAPINGB_P005712 [Saprochaete ingens]VVT57471.1 unnamed protein product [Saprochaete ingens]